MTERASSLRHTVLSRLKLRHLALLQSVERHRTLSRVALEMKLSQPAITKALRERLERERAARQAEGDLPKRIREFAARIQGNFDTRPVTGAEWDWASGDEA